MFNRKGDDGDYSNVDGRPRRKINSRRFTHGSEDDKATVTPTGDRAGSLIVTPVNFSLRIQQWRMFFGNPGGRMKSKL